MQKISLLDFPSKCDVCLYIGFKPHFIKFLIKEVRKEFRTYKELGDYLSKRALLYNLKISKGRDKIYAWLERGRIPLWVVKEIVKLVKLNKETIDKNVIFYGLWSSPINIIKPRLPIKVTPTMASIVGHIMGDGCASDKYSMIYYAQHREEYTKLFAKKVENIFGKFGKLKNKKFNLIKSRIYFKKEKKFKTFELKLPHFIKDIISDYYKINKWGCKKIKINNKLLNMDRYSKLAFITALIIDEGNVENSGVSIASTNYKFINGVDKIIKSLSYKSTIYRYKHNGEYFVVIKDIPKIYNDIKNLTKMYRELNLGVKGKKIDLMVKIRKNKVKFDIKDSLIQQLKKKESSISELQRDLLIRRDRLFYHIKKLERSGLVKQSSKSEVFGGDETVWALNAYPSTYARI